VGGYKRFFRLVPGDSKGLKRDLDQEIETHIALRTEALIESGLTPEAARDEAVRRFGDLNEAKQRLLESARRRESSLGSQALLEDLRRDLILALRQVRRSPGFSATAVTIFALAIGLTTSMFSVVDHVLLRPLPFPEPTQLVTLQSVAEQGGSVRTVSMANWVDWHSRNTTLSASAIYRIDRVTVEVDEQVQRAAGSTVAGGFFETLRPTMAAGRPFSEKEAEEGALVTVLAEGFASQMLGLNSVGGVVTIEGVARTVVGVVASGGRLPADADLWIPRPSRAGSGGLRNNINWQAVARLRSNTDAVAAQAELSAIAESIRRSDPEGVYSYGVHVTPLQETLTSEAQDYLGLLMGAVLLVLLVACANLAGLSLARGRSRTQEFGIRLALGADRARLIRQHMTEHVMFAVAGGALGLMLAWFGSGVLSQLIRRIVPRAEEVTLDYRVAAMCFLVTLVAGVLAGVGPALRGSAGSALTGLIGARGGIRGGRGLPGATLVAAEIALALSLLIGGGLLLRSFQTIINRDLGFTPGQVLTADVTLVGDAYASPGAAERYWIDLITTVSALPGVKAAAAGNWIPTGRGGRSFIELPDNPDPGFGAGYRVVSGRYFETLEIPILAGRGFLATDASGSDRVTLVNGTLADQAWPGEDPIGQRIRPFSMESWMYQGDPPWLTVVGVVGDVRHYGYEEDVQGELFVVLPQVPLWASSMTAVIRASSAITPAFISTVREAIRSVDASQAAELASLDDRVGELMAERRLILGLLTAFSAAALLLACLGVYGLVSFAAAQRTREIAIRGALGAGRGGLLSLMLMSATRILVIGVAVGTFSAYWLTKLMASLIVDVPTTDPATYLTAVAILIAVGMLSALIPSWRAAKLDPLHALQAE